MKLSYFPQIKVIHTSTIFHGQLYIQLANWLLIIGTILVASIYNNVIETPATQSCIEVLIAYQTTSLGNAYGVCVMFFTFFDTCMVSMVATFVWRISPFLVFLPWLSTACMDRSYLSAALTKVPAGAWFTIALAGVLAIAFLLLRFGKEQQWLAEAEDRFPSGYFIRRGSDDQMKLTDRFGGTALTTTKGLGIFFDKAGENTPIVYSQFVLKLTSMPEVIVFFHLRPLESPSVPMEDRYAVSQLAIPNCYRLVVRYEYNDEINTPDLGNTITDQIRTYLKDRTFDGRSDEEKAASSFVTKTSQSHSGAQSTGPGESENHTIGGVGGAGRMNTLENAYAHGVICITGKEQIKVRKSANYARTVALWLFVWLRENTRAKITSLRLQADRIIEVGFVKDI